MLKLKEDICKLIVSACRLKIAPEQIDEDIQLFGNEGLNLDSVDALQIVVAIDKNYGIDIPEEKLPELLTVKLIAEFIASQSTIPNCENAES
ncbi:MAG: acyl carrier protein [Legionella sp.]|nr:acyl carrier protein [Legionella sp.]